MFCLVHVSCFGGFVWLLFFVCFFGGGGGELGGWRDTSFITREYISDIHVYASYFWGEFDINLYDSHSIHTIVTGKYSQRMT